MTWTPHQRQTVICHACSWRSHGKDLNEAMANMLDHPCPGYQPPEPCRRRFTRAWRRTATRYVWPALGGSLATRWLLGDTSAGSWATAAALAVLLALAAAVPAAVDARRIANGTV